MPELYDPKERRKRYGALRASLWTERAAGFDSHWRELGDFLVPRRTRFWAGDRNKGDRRNQNIIDSTGRFAARTLSSGLHAGLTSPARPWMKLSTPDPDLAEFGPVREWLHVVTQRMLTVFATSNLYNVLPLVYLDLGVFGTAAMSIVEDTRDLFRCYSYPLGTFALGQDARGLATTFVREYELSVRQIVEQFGVVAGAKAVDWTNISAPVRGQWERGDYEQPVRVTWIVQPNELRDRNRLGAKYLPWTSCYFETDVDEGKFLRESGFRTFPIMAPRWDITGEDTYGTDCPGMTALGDVKQLQVEQREKAKMLKKAVSPALRGPTSLLSQRVSTVPDDITYVDARDGAQGLAPIHEVRLEGFQYITADIREVQARIQRAFYEDLFLMLATSDNRLGADRPTAREIDERHEEKLLALGPVLERTNDELLDPIVDRVYDLMEHAGLLPPPPPELEGVDLKVEYISILSQAQKLVGVVGQDRFFSTVGQLVKLFPEARYKVDVMQGIDNWASMLGVDPRLLRSTDEARADLKAERQAAQAQQASEVALKGAQAAQAASQAPVSGDTVLSRMVQAAQAAPGGTATP